MQQLAALKGAVSCEGALTTGDTVIASNVCGFSIA
jgi:hypothetical protein